MGEGNNPLPQGFKQKGQDNGNCSDPTGHRPRQPEPMLHFRSVRHWLHEVAEGSSVCDGQRRFGVDSQREAADDTPHRLPRPLHSRCLLRHGGIPHGQPFQLLNQKGQKNDIHPRRISVRSPPPQVPDHLQYGWQGALVRPSSCC